MLIHSAKWLSEIRLIASFLHNKFSKQKPNVTILNKSFSSLLELKKKDIIWNVPKLTILLILISTIAIWKKITMTPRSLVNMFAGTLVNNWRIVYTLRKIWVSLLTELSSNSSNILSQKSKINWLESMKLQIDISCNIMELINMWRKISMIESS